jgi:hypothetical protein
MTYDLTAEKEVQLGRAKAVLRPLMCIVSVGVFVVCFWKFQIGLLLSLIATVVSWPLLLVGVAFPVGYALGKRAARRYKERLSRDTLWAT